jgi:hypothetical protein
MASVEQNENEVVNHTENDQEWFASSSQLDGTPSDKSGSTCNHPKKSSCRGVERQEQRIAAKCVKLQNW